jgi:hypothetical protein
MIFLGCTKRLHKFQVSRAVYRDTHFSISTKRAQGGVNLQGILRLVRPVYKYVHGGLINRGAARAVRKLH